MIQIVIIFKYVTSNIQGIYTCSNFLIYLKLIKKEISCIGTTISIFYNNLQKILLKN
jgi:hypothetical protein